MKNLCIVQCGEKKIWKKHPEAGPTKAKDVYVGPLAKKCVEYAEKFHTGHYRILSAKYGLISPDFMIPEDYNVTFNKLSTQPVSIQQLREQAEKTGLLKEYKKIIVLGNKEYISRIRVVFNDHVIHTPLSECKGIGYMLHHLKTAIQRESCL